MKFPNTSLCSEVPAEVHVAAQWSPPTRALDRLGSLRRCPGRCNWGDLYQSCFWTLAQPGVQLLIHLRGAALHVHAPSEVSWWARVSERKKPACRAIHEAKRGLVGIISVMTVRRFVMTVRT